MTAFSAADAVGALALVAVAAAAAIDAIRYEIPDKISVAVAALAVAYGALHPGFAWGWHAAGLAAMFAFGLLAFARGWLGGGDVKLMTAIAGWTGLFGLPLFFVATSVAGGGLALAYWLGRRAGGATVARPRLPYAVAILLCTIWWLWAVGGRVPA